MRILFLISLFFLLSLLINSPSLAGNPFLASNRCKSIEGSISSVVADFSAACANSWKGSGQVWENLEEFVSPAETEVESSCPLVRGITSLAYGSSDPTFVGNAGQKGSYFLLDGTNYFTMPTTANKFVNMWGKTTGGHNFTFVMTFKFVSSASVNQYIFANRTATAGYNRGVALWIDTENKVNFTQRGDSADVTIRNTTAMTNGGNYVVMVSHAGNFTRLWVGTETSQLGAQTFDTTSDDPSEKLVVGARPDVTTPYIAVFMLAGTRIYDVQYFNAAFDNTIAATDIAILEARNGIDFTP